MTFVFEAVLRDDPDDPDGAFGPVLKRIFDVYCRNSMIIVSSGVAGLASGQIKLCEIQKHKSTNIFVYLIKCC
jgi:hypothetical protein